MRRNFVLFAVCFLAASFEAYALAEPKPFELLTLPGTGADPAAIDYAALPRLAGPHAVVRAAVCPKVGEKYEMHQVPFQLHSYLAHHEGRFWCLWSEGPPIEDEPTQEVRYATSEDGLNWSPSKSVTGRPDAPYAFIARGLWVRDGELLALAATFKGKGAFGADKELELRAYVWNEQESGWKLKGTVYKDAINNFPPQRLPSDEWITTRRDARFNVSMLIGGRCSLDDWKAFPVVQRGEVAGFSPDEPIFWPLPDQSLLALFRDNGGSQRLFQATSNDHGRTWSKPALTNFPNATSKLFSLETSRGTRILISNANPKAGRRELHFSLSRDGKTFTRMALLDVPSPPPVAGLESLWRKFESRIASLQYPHAIEADGKLLITYSRNKKQIELIQIPLESVESLIARGLPSNE